MGASCTATLLAKCALPAVLEKDAGFCPDGPQTDGNVFRQIIDEVKVHSFFLDIC
jgi:hypothetical protein